MYEHIKNFGLTEAIRNRPRRKAQSKIILLNGVNFTIDSVTVHKETFNPNEYNSFKDFQKFCSKLKQSFLNPEKVKLSTFTVQYSPTELAYNLGFLGDIIAFQIKDSKKVLKTLKLGKNGLEFLRDRTKKERLELQKKYKKPLTSIAVYSKISPSVYMDGINRAEKLLKNEISDKNKFIFDGSILASKQITLKGCNPNAKQRKVTFSKFDLKNKTVKRTSKNGKHISIELDIFDSFFTSFDKQWNETKRKKNFDNWNTAKKQQAEKETIINTVAKMLQFSPVGTVSKFIRSIPIGLMSMKKQFRVNYKFNESTRTYECLKSNSPQSKVFYSKKDAEKIISLATLLNLSKM